MPRIHGGRRIRRGFTALELVLVMAIAGVLLAIAAPHVAAARDGASVRAAAADLSELFSVARETAIARRTLVTIAIDTAGGAVEVRAAGGRVVRRALSAAYGIVLGSNRDSTVYDARGLGYGVSNLTVTLRRGAVVDTLTMSRLGRVRW